MKTLIYVGSCGLLVAIAGVARGALSPTPIGTGPQFHPSALSVAVARGTPIGSLRCRRSERRRVGVHLELFARGRVVIVPAGVGVAPPSDAQARSSSRDSARIHFGPVSQRA